jgi:2-haloacid dehalogenase
MYEMESTAIKRDPTTRRTFVGTAAAVVLVAALQATAIAQAHSARIKAVAFDAFAIFDARSVSHLAEQLLPGRGVDLMNAWSRRQFEYTWLRNSMGRYADFWHVTEDALNYATIEAKVRLEAVQKRKLLSAFLELKPWPDVPHVLELLRSRGLRLALLSNMTSTMMQSCVESSGLDAMLEHQLSTDAVKRFKPDPAAYRMAPETFHIKTD